MHKVDATVLAASCSCAYGRTFRDHIHRACRIETADDIVVSPVRLFTSLLQLHLFSETELITPRSRLVLNTMAATNDNNKRPRQLSPTPPGDPPPKKANTAEDNDVLLAEDGDVLLKFSDGTRTRVASSVLSLASPVFRKMLGPDFLEGQAARSADAPKLISLPEDDPTAAMLLLSLLHFEPPSSETITAVNLAKLAEMADKYACTKPIALMSETLLKRCVAERSKEGSKESLQTVARLFMAAHLLGQKKLFVELSRILVLEMTESFSSIMDLEGCKHLSPMVICMWPYITQ